MKQREIKFRAWNPHTNTMFDYGQLSIMIMGQVFNMGYIPMQFTGLKDKNGKEIYEGDIVQVAMNKKYQVKFCDEGECSHELYGGCFVLYANKELFFPFDEFAMKHGGVIGNIYENPELLKK